MKRKVLFIFIVVLCCVFTICSSAESTSQDDYVEITESIILQTQLKDWYENSECVDVISYKDDAYLVYVSYDNSRYFEKNVPMYFYFAFSTGNLVLDSNLLEDLTKITYAQKANNYDTVVTMKSSVKTFNELARDMKTINVLQKISTFLSELAGSLVGGCISGGISNGDSIAEIVKYTTEQIKNQADIKSQVSYLLDTIASWEIRQFYDEIESFSALYDKICALENNYTYIATFEGATEYYNLMYEFQKHNEILNAMLPHIEDGADTPIDTILKVILSFGNGAVGGYVGGIAKEFSNHINDEEYLKQASYDKILAFSYVAYQYLTTGIEIFGNAQDILPDLTGVSDLYDAVDEALNNYSQPSSYYNLFEHAKLARNLIYVVCINEDYNDAEEDSGNNDSGTTEDTFVDLYDEDAALAYAAEHWNDGKGLCAEFVSDCINQGGCDAWSTGATSLMAQLKETGMGSVYELPMTFSGNAAYVKMSDCGNVLVPGDAVFYYCDSCNDGKAYNIHVVLCNGMDGDGYMKAYSHNNANDGSSKYAYGRYCYDCGSEIDGIYVFHFENSSSSEVQLPKIEKYYITFALEIDNIVYDSYVYYPGRDNWYVPTPEFEEYNFLGWYCDKKFTKPILEPSEITDDMVFWGKVVPKFNYTVDLYGNATIIGMVPDRMDVTIPAEVDGYKVVAIGENAFIEDENLVYVKISEGITEIGKYAFRNCKSLTTVLLPDGITTIRDYAFDACTSLKDINLTDSIKEIGEFAFAECHSITSMEIPYGITKIQRGTFSGMHTLESITIPNSVTEINESAFQCCYVLDNVVIPDSVISLGKKSFYDCRELTNLTLSNSITTIESYTFYNTKLAKIIIPESVTELKDFAICCCHYLTEATIPSSVNTIGQIVFGCTDWFAGSSQYPSALVGAKYLHRVIYTGSQKQWNSISINTNNIQLNDAQIVFKSPLMADYDGDSAVTVIDAMLILKEVLNNKPLRYIPDVNGDEKLNLIDVLHILKVVVS